MIEHRIACLVAYFGKTNKVSKPLPLNIPQLIRQAKIGPISRSSDSRQKLINSYISKII